MKNTCRHPSIYHSLSKLWVDMGVPCMQRMLSWSSGLQSILFMWLTLLVHRVIRRPVCLTHIALLRVVNKFRSDILSPVSIRDVYCIIQSDKYEQGVPTICPYKRTFGSEISCICICLYAAALSNRYNILIQPFGLFVVVVV